MFDPKRAVIMTVKEILEDRGAVYEHRTYPPRREFEEQYEIFGFRTKVAHPEDDWEDGFGDDAIALIRFYDGKVELLNGFGATLARFRASTYSPMGVVRVLHINSFSIKEMGAAIELFIMNIRKSSYD